MFSPFYPPVDFKSQEQHKLHEPLIFLYVHHEVAEFLMFKKHNKEVYFIK